MDLVMSGKGKEIRGAFVSVWGVAVLVKDRHSAPKPENVSEGKPSYEGGV